MNPIREDFGFQRKHLASHNERNQFQTLEWDPLRGTYKNLKGPRWGRDQKEEEKLHFNITFPSNFSFFCLFSCEIMHFSSFWLEIFFKWNKWNASLGVPNKRCFIVRTCKPRRLGTTDVNYSVKDILPCIEKILWTQYVCNLFLGWNKKKKKN